MFIVKLVAINELSYVFARLLLGFLCLPVAVCVAVLLNESALLAYTRSAGTTGAIVNAAT